MEPFTKLLELNQKVIFPNSLYYNTSDLLICQTAEELYFQRSIQRTSEKVTKPDYIDGFVPKLKKELFTLYPTALVSSRNCFNIAFVKEPNYFHYHSIYDFSYSPIGNYVCVVFSDQRTIVYAIDGIFDPQNTNVYSPYPIANLSRILFKRMQERIEQSSISGEKRNREEKDDEHEETEETEETEADKETEEATENKKRKTSTSKQTTTTKDNAEEKTITKNVELTTDLALPVVRTQTHPEEAIIRAESLNAKVCCFSPLVKVTINKTEKTGLLLFLVTHIKLYAFFSEINHKKIQLDNKIDYRNNDEKEFILIAELTTKESSCSINVYPKDSKDAVSIEDLKISSFGKFLKLLPKNETQYEFKEIQKEEDLFQKQLRAAPIYYTKFLNDSHLLFLSTSGLFLQTIEKQNEELFNSLNNDKVNANTEKEQEKENEKEKEIEDKKQNTTMQQQTQQELLNQTQTQKTKKDLDIRSYFSTSHSNNNQSQNKSISETDLQQQQQQQQQSSSSSSNKLQEISNIKPSETEIKNKSKDYVIFRTFGNTIKIAGIELKETTLSLFIGNKSKIYFASFDLSKEHKIENEEMQITSNYEFQSEIIFSLKNSEVTSLFTSDYNLFLYFTLKNSVNRITIYKTETELENIFQIVRTNNHSIEFLEYIFENNKPFLKRISKYLNSVFAEKINSQNIFEMNEKELETYLKELQFANNFISKFSEIFNFSKIEMKTNIISKLVSFILKKKTDSIYFIPLKKLLLENIPFEFDIGETCPFCSEKVLFDSINSAKCKNGHSINRFSDSLKLCEVCEKTRICLCCRKAQEENDFTLDTNQYCSFCGEKII